MEYSNLISVLSSPFTSHALAQIEMFHLQMNLHLKWSLWTNEKLVG